MPRNPESLTQVLDALRQGRRWSVILIHGNDPFLLREAVDRIIEILLPESSRMLALEVFEGSADAGSVVEALRTYSFIAGSKVVWVRDASFFDSKETNRDLIDRAAAAYAEGRMERAVDLTKKALSAAGWRIADVAGGEWRRMPEAIWREGMGFERDIAALAWLDAVLERVEADPTTADEEAGVLEGALEGGWPEGHVLILSSAVVDRRRGLYKAIARSGLILDCSLETRSSKDRRDSAQKVREVLVARLGEAGKKMRPDALKELEERVGADPGRLSQEVDKLAAFAGERPEVTRRDVEALVAESGDAALYELNNAVMAGDTSETVRLLRKLVESGCHPLAIVSSLANEVRRMMRCRGALEGPLADRWRDGLTFSEFENAVLPELKTAGMETAGHPYGLYQSYLKASRLDGRRLVRMHSLLLDADLSLKSGDARFALDTMILKCGRETTSQRGGLH